jgi:hypothetical protein
MNTVDRHILLLLFLINAYELTNGDPPTQGELWKVIRKILEEADDGSNFEGYPPTDGAPPKFRSHIQGLIQNGFVGFSNNRLALTEVGRSLVPEPDADPFLLAIMSYV